MTEKGAEEQVLAMDRLLMFCTVLYIKYKNTSKVN